MSQAQPDAVRHCIKCGREIGADETLCAVCNRAGMNTPSASQYHGTVAVAIVLAVVGLAVAASLSMRGVGPYDAALLRVVPADPSGYTISFAVTNQGTREGRAKCALVALDADGRRLRSVGTVTTPIPGGATVDLSQTIPGLETEPARITIGCS